MSVAATYMSGAIAFLRRDAALFLSYRTRLVTIVASSVFGLVMFHFIAKLVSVKQFPSPEAYFAFVVIGMVSLTVLTSTLSSGPAAIRQELVAGTFERLLVSPFGAVAGIMSMSVFPVVFGLVTGGMTLGLAAVLFNIPITWSTAPLAIPAALLGAVSFLPFGLLISAAMITMKQAAGASNFIVTGIAITSGLYFPVALLPAWIRWTSDVQPFTPAVDLLRHLLLGTAMDDPWHAVAKILGFTLVLLPLSMVALAGAVRFGRRRGTISEY